MLMNNFNTTGGDNPQIVQQLGSQLLTPDTHAVLYLVEPKFVPDQCRRPHVYTFGGEFKDELAQTIQECATKDINTVFAGIMKENRSMSHAVMPSKQGSHINLSPFRDFWTFVLIVDCGSVSPFSGIARTIPQRMLFSGWIAGEAPAVKMHDRADTWAFNEQAVLVITHQTTMSINSTIGPSGRNIVNIDTTGDFDYVDRTVVNTLRPAGSDVSVHNLQPGAVAKAVLPDPLGYPDNFTIAPRTLQADTQKRSLEIASDFNSPAFHLKKIVGGLIDGVSQMGAGPRKDVFVDSDAMLASVAGLMSVGRNIPVGGIDASQPQLLGTIMRKYGDGLNVTVVHNQKDPAYELGKPFEPTTRNLVSSILSDVLPPLLAEWGIAEVTFRYNSTIRETNPDPLFRSASDMGAFQIDNIASLYPMSEDGLKASWNIIRRYLKDIVFPMVLEAAGHFDVNVHCSLSGSTLVQVNLYDDMYGADTGIIETNNLLGGINSPLIGTTDEFSHNAGQLYGVIRDVAQPAATGEYNLAPAMVANQAPIYTGPAIADDADVESDTSLDNYASKLAKMF